MDFEKLCYLLNESLILLKKKIFLFSNLFLHLYRDRSKVKN